MAAPASCTKSEPYSGPLGGEVLTQAALDNAGWVGKEVLPYFIKCEHNTRGASEYHGEDRPHQSLN